MPRTEKDDMVYIMVIEASDGHEYCEICDTRKRAEQMIQSEIEEVNSVELFYGKRIKFESKVTIIH